MLERKDVDILLRAKRDRTVVDVLMGLSSVSLAALILLEASGTNHGYTIILATASIIFTSAAIGQNKWVSVSRDQLVQTLERIINKNPEALKILAQKKQGGD